MPKEFVMLSFLACCTKGLTLADARCPSLNEDDRFRKGMVYIQVTIQSCLGQWNGTGRLKFVMEGMLEGE